MSRVLVFILALMLSLQSMIAVADLHWLHLNEGSVLHLDAGEHTGDHEQHGVAAPSDTAQTPDSERCQHCCHCHHGSAHFIANKFPSLFADTPSSDTFAKGIFFSSWIGSPGLRPPAA